MTLDNFTIKAQETVQEAMNITQRAGQQTLEPTHLLKGLLTKAKDITNFLFQKTGVNGAHVEQPQRGIYIRNGRKIVIK